MAGPDAAHIVNALIIPHPARPALAVTDAAGGPALPVVEDTTGRHFTRVDWLNALVRERFGISATVLRCAFSQVDDSRTGARIFVLETPAPVASGPAGLRWAGRDELERSPLSDREQRVQVETWLSEAEGGPVSPLRAPWARPGWFAGAAEWTARTAAAHGMQPTGPLEQLRAWTISTILKVPTPSGDLYLKASGGPFSQEAALTAALAARWPLHFPVVVENDLAHGRMLMRDLDGMRLDRVRDVARWAAALDTYARLQLEASNDVEALLAAGCQDRRLSGLHAEIDATLVDTAAMAPATPNRLTDGEIEQVQALAPMLHDAVDRLAAAPVPETLEHGDFHPGNIVDRPPGARIYDWSDACVAHPFFSLLPFFTFDSYPPGLAGAAGRLRAAYLDPWRRYATMPELLELAAVAERVAVIQQVTSYRRILDAVEPQQRWEWTHAIPYFLRLLLRRTRPEGRAVPEENNP